MADEKTPLDAQILLSDRDGCSGSFCEALKYIRSELKRLSDAMSEEVLCRQMKVDGLQNQYQAHYERHDKDTTSWAKVTDDLRKRLAALEGLALKQKQHETRCSLKIVCNEGIPDGAIYIVGRKGQAVTITMAGDGQ